MDQDIKLLLRAARAAPSADNSQPWCFTLGDRMFSVSFDSGRAADGFFGPESPATLLAIGGLTENIKETASLLGSEVRIENLVEPSKVGFPYLKVDAGEPHKSQLPEALSVWTRHTNRFPFRSQPVDEETLHSISALQESPARLLVITDSAQIGKTSQLVTMASEIRFQTKEIHLWLIRSLRFSEKEIARGDGLDVNTLLLPPAGKALLRFIGDWKRMEILNRFGAYKLLAREEAKLIGKAPALIAVLAPRSIAGILAAGQLMSRAWTSLNMQKVAVQPYYVVPDQLNRLQEGLIPSKLVSKAELLYSECQQIFGSSENDNIHMLLRIGYPKVDPLRSRRLPLKTLVR